MVHVTEVSAAVSILSAILSLGLLAFALNGYRRTREGAMAFLAAAFTIFGLKSAFVGYAVLTGAVEHSMTELVDAIGDLMTVALILAPVLWPPGDA